MKALTCLFFVLIFLSVYGQDASNITIGGEYSENFAIRNYAGSIQFEGSVGDKVSLNYKLLLGGSTNQTLYVHAPVGAAAGVLLLKTFAGSELRVVNALGIILLVIPEGITFYPNPESRIRTGVYIAPLGCDYWVKNKDYEYFRFSGEIGGKVKIPLSKDGSIDLQLQGGIRYLYRNKTIDPFFIHAGAGISINLD